MSESNASSNAQSTRRAGHILAGLLNILYPPPPNPDIITLEDVLNRYRLTGLGVPAITALQQAQRILRASKDYDQIGLCEFHIGLIYLHWGHCLAAAQQFSEARRQWSFADTTASVCLSYFSQGYAQHLALHYESAMGCYHKTEQSLPRLKLSPPSARLDEFVTRLTELLYGTQETLREKMWPPDELEQTSESRTAEQQETADTPSSEQEPINTAPYYVVNEAETPPLTFPITNYCATPIDNSQRPLPPEAYLLKTNEFYKWYRVTHKPRNTLPSIREGMLLLVDTRIRDNYDNNEIILIGQDKDEQGSVQVKPLSQTMTC